MRLTGRWISVSLLTLCLMMAGWTVYGQKVKTAKPAWEYKIVIIPRSSDKAQIIMNEHGAEGWELVQARFPTSEGNDFALLFKRPK